MKRSLTVQQLSNYLKTIIVQDAILKNVYLEGEVTNYKKNKYIYFDIKDEKAVINCVYFNHKNEEFFDGQKLLLRGSINTFESRSTYQLNIKEVVADGFGQQYFKLEELKNKLDKKGYFSELNKKIITRYPIKIGVVASEKSAAIQDFYKVLNDESYFGKIHMCDCLVQGIYAENSIVSALRYLDKKNLDLIVITRGGGSVEDLSVFNGEKLADTIFNSKTPILSAVGHERDFTICDLVADVRVSTPTKAGHFIVSNFKVAEIKINELKQNNSYILHSLIKNLFNLIEATKNSIESYSPVKLIEKKLNSIEFIQFNIKENYTNLFFDKYKNLELIKNEIEYHFKNILDKNKIKIFNLEESEFNFEKLEIGKKYFIKNELVKYKIKVLEKFDV